MTRPAADLPDGLLEGELRAAFAEATADLPATTDPWARTTRAVARSRTRRQLTAGALAVAAAVAVAGAVLPLGRTAPAPSHRVPGPTVTSADVTTWPTRGNLAQRADLLARVRTAVSADGTVLAVPFLGEVDGLDVAMAVASGPDENGQVTQKIVTLTGPASQPVTSWDHSEGPLPEAGPVPVLSAALASGDQARFVVVTVSSGVSAAYSARPDIDDRGVVGRLFTGLPLEDGVGAVTVPGPASAATLRLQRGDETPQVGPFGHTSEPPPGAPAAAMRGIASTCKGNAFEIARVNIDNWAIGAATQAGRAVSEISQIRVLWCRKVGAHTVMLVGVRLSDGTALQTVLEDVEFKDGHGFMGGWRAWPVPRGREATYPRYVRLTPVEGEPAAAVRRAALLFAPRGATAELVSGPQGTTVLARVRLGADGAGVGQDPKVPAGVDEDLYIVVRDAAGRVVERVPVPSPTQDTWGTTLDAPVQLH